MREHGQPARRCFRPGRGRAGPACVGAPVRDTSVFPGQDQHRVRAGGLPTAVVPTACNAAVVPTACNTAWSIHGALHGPTLFLCESRIYITYFVKWYFRTLCAPVASPPARKVCTMSCCTFIHRTAKSILVPPSPSHVARLRRLRRA